MIGPLSAYFVSLSILIYIYVLHVHMGSLTTCLCCLNFVGTCETVDLQVSVQFSHLLILHRHNGK